MDARGRHFRDGGGDVGMTRGKEWVERAVSRVRPSPGLGWQWAAFALRVILMIAISDNGQTFASLVTNSRGRNEVYSPVPHQTLTVRSGQVTANLVSREQELLRSIEVGENDHAKALLVAGVSANTTDQQGWTPLMLAALHNRTALIPVLYGHGADPNAKNAKGTTALMLAANNGHKEMVHLLLDRGVQVNTKTTAGWTALMYAAWKGHTVIAAELLRVAADPTIIDSQSWTALMYAVWQGHTETVAVLLRSQKGEARHGGERKRARALANSQGHTAIVHLLDEKERRG